MNRILSLVRRCVEDYDMIQPASVKRTTILP